jgi:cytochrome c oxidase cbb3-type subunit 3
MRATSSMPVVLALALAAAAACATACDRAPSSSDLPEWTPKDHASEPGRPAANQGRLGEAGDGGVAVQVELTWRNLCSNCHGPSGHGDGPQGPMFKPTDLTKADWQAKVTDADIANAIKNGKGRMPKFDLPDEIVPGLVARVRSFRGQ